MSLTQWLTRSPPHESWRPIAIATFSFVPTPSVEATRTGSRYFEKSGRKRPPKPPTSPRTPGVNVERIAAFARASAAALASMSTPASAYREVIGGGGLYRPRGQKRGDGAPGNAAGVGHVRDDVGAPQIRARVHGAAVDEPAREEDHVSGARRQGHQALRSHGLRIDAQVVQVVERRNETRDAAERESLQRGEGFFARRLRIVAGAGQRSRPAERSRDEVRQPPPADENGVLRCTAVAPRNDLQAARLPGSVVESDPGRQSELRPVDVPIRRVLVVVHD